MGQELMPDAEGGHAGPMASAQRRGGFPARAGTTD